MTLNDALDALGKLLEEHPGPNAFKLGKAYQDVVAASEDLTNGLRAEAQRLVKAMQQLRAIEHELETMGLTGDVLEGVAELVRLNKAFQCELHGKDDLEASPETGRIVMSAIEPETAWAESCERICRAYTSIFPSEEVVDCEAAIIHRLRQHSPLSDIVRSYRILVPSEVTLREARPEETRDETRRRYLNKVMKYYEGGY